MSEHFWTRVGAIGALLAGIGGTVAIVIWWTTPAAQLVAEIRPVEFKLPLTDEEIKDLTGFSFKPLNDKSIIQSNSTTEKIKKIAEAAVLIRIDLINNGDLPVKSIRANVADAMLYTRSQNNRSFRSGLTVLPSTQYGISLDDDLPQGGIIALYVWTDTFPGVYKLWYDLDKRFQISFSQGLARKHIYIEGSDFAGWLDRNGPTIIIFSCGLIVLISMLMSAIYFSKQTENTPRNVVEENSEN